MIKPINTPFDTDDSIDIPEFLTEAEIDFDPSDFSEEEAFYQGQAAAEHETAKQAECLDNLRREVEEFFVPGGVLKQHAIHDAHRPYEFRPQQMRMGSAIVEALANGENLAVEAPTGVGKSFAYLVPLIYRSKFAKYPALVTTETINLQEQLIHKDIPFLKKVTGVDFKAVLAKGRSNYLCMRRYSLVMQGEREALLPVPSLAFELEKIESKINSTNGERSDFNFRISSDLWGMIHSEAGNCLGPKCPFYKKCFYFGARREWETADIIVANHALFFTDLRIKMQDMSDTALLPQYGMAVIDEAHTLEANAADHLGLSVSKLGVISLLNRLYNPDNGKGLLVRNGKKAMECRQICAKARDVSYTFFKQFENYCEERHETALRVRQTGLFDNSLGTAMGELRERLDELFDELEEDASVQTEIGSYIDRVAGVIDAISEFLLLGNEKSVYYIECDNRNTSLHGAPLNIAEILKREIFDASFPVILSSATLTINGKFDFFFNRTGFVNGKTLVLDSPFDPERVAMYIPDDMPEVQGEEHFKKLVAYIKHFVKMTHGKAFVLFTSYSLLQKTAETMRGFFEAEDINLLVQGGDLTRSMLLEEFKNDVDSVLFGTDSFWTGVDVPGEALSNVIITKLPFAVPSHPLIASRCEEIEKQGGNSFRDYSIPDAVLRFRQGIGRLIRSKTDKGIIAILDKRVVSKFYGRNFLNSIPYKRKMM